MSPPLRCHSQRPERLQYAKPRGNKANKNMGKDESNLCHLKSEEEGGIFK